MNSFEQLVKGMLEVEGYWVRASYKVNLTKEEKVKIGRPSSPRWEIDLLAYKGSTNEVLVVECKSFLDSTGVSCASLFDSGPGAKLYKLFTEDKLRKVVFARVRKQLVAEGAVAAKPAITLCLAAGKTKSESDHARIQQVFAKRGWRLFDRTWMQEKLKEASASAYEDNIATMVAKILSAGGNGLPPEAST